MNIDTILGITGTILGIFGLITGYVFYRRSLKLKEPLYSISSNNLIQDNVSRMTGLEVSYKGHKIENLTVSKILIWNNGSDTIERSDIVTANPLRVGCSSGNHILDASVLESNNSSSQISVELEKTGDNAQIFFDYLDKGHGAIIQVIHTGKTSDDIIVKGDLKGATLRIYKSKRKWVSEIGDLFFPLLISMVVITTLDNPLDIRLGWGVTIYFAVAAAAIVVYLKLRRWSKEGAYPKDFKNFGDIESV